MATLRYSTIKAIYGETQFYSNFELCIRTHKQIVKETLNNIELLTQINRGLKKEAKTIQKQLPNFAITLTNITKDINRYINTKFNK